MQTALNLKTVVWALFGAVSLSQSLAQDFKGVNLVSASTGKGYAICASCTVPKNLSSVVWLAAKDEPGEVVVLMGTVYKSDGVSPDSGVVLFVYQADAGGYYHRPEEDVFHPKLFGWLKTDRDGRYEIHTVKPAPEVLAQNEPAHIHVHVFGKGMPEHFLHEFWFEGDRRISAEERDRIAKLGSFSPVVTLVKDKSGVLRGTRNFKIKSAPPWRYEPD